MAVDLILDGEDGVALLSVDARLRETHVMTTRVTAFPVEGGASLSDHIYNEPEQVTVEGFVTNTPVVSVFSRTELPSILAPPNQDYVGAAFDVLESLRELRKPVILLTGLRRYPDMVMTRLEVPRDATTGQAMAFIADFMRIRKVATQTTDIPAEKLQPGKPQDQGEGRTNTGKATGSQISESETASILKQGYEKISETISNMLLGEGAAVAP